MHDEQVFKSGSVRWVIGTDKYNMNSTDRFVRSEFLDVFGNRQLKNATVAYAYFDENDVKRQTTIIGPDPSPEMQQVMDLEFGTEETPPSVARSA